MMEKLVVTFIACLVSIGVYAFNGNYKARTFGGTMTVELAYGERVVNCTWKDKNLWVLKEVNPNIAPRTLVFEESSLFGVLEGKVIFKEK